MGLLHGGDSQGSRSPEPAVGRARRRSSLASLVLPSRAGSPKSEAPSQDQGQGSRFPVYGVDPPHRRESLLLPPCGGGALKPDAANHPTEPVVHGHRRHSTSTLVGLVPPRDAAQVTSGSSDLGHWRVHSSFHPSHPSRQADPMGRSSRRHSTVSLGTGLFASDEQIASLEALVPRKGSKEKINFPRIRSANAPYVGEAEEPRGTEEKAEARSSAPLAVPTLVFSSAPEGARPPTREIHPSQRGSEAQPGSRTPRSSRSAAELSGRRSPATSGRGPKLGKTSGASGASVHAGNLDTQRPDTRGSRRAGSKTTPQRDVCLELPFCPSNYTDNLTGGSDQVRQQTAEMSDIAGRVRQRIDAVNRLNLVSQEMEEFLERRRLKKAKKASLLVVEA